MNVAVHGQWARRSPAEVGGSVDEFRPFGGLLRGELEVEQGSALELSTLTPLQRVLMATDGTVTHLLEAYCLEPIDVVGIDQRARVLRGASRWLDTEPGTTVLARQVLLRGHDSGTIHLYAASLIVPDRLPPPIRRELLCEGSGIGRSLVRHGLENRREILSRRRRRTTGLPLALRELLGSEVSSRTYRVIADGRPMMLINENFPAHPEK